MKHFGDITKISGYTAPIVDCIIGGSPCQDLSIAGRGAGLAGERSGLFMEQIRIIREMREQSERTTGVSRPRFAVWENVPGALSSHKSEDFRIVLERFCKIAEETAVIPRPPKGKWGGAGCIVGDGWSVAWRILDAQFWGVPQRRRRIALVADFGGYTAPEILFERKSMFGDSETGEKTREGIAGGTENSTESTGVYVFKGGNGAKAGLSLSGKTAPCLTAAGSGTNQAPTICLNDQGGSAMNVSENISGTLRAQEHGHQPIVYNGETITSKTNASNPHPRDPCHTLGAAGTGRAICIQGNCIDRADTAGCNGKGWRYDKSYTLNTIDRPAVYDARGNGDGETAPTLTGDHARRVSDYTAITYQKTTGPLMANSHPGSYTGQDAYNDMSIAHTLTASSNCKQCEDRETYPIQYGSVRRLTPLECERLQGYPDGWTDIGDWIDSKGKKRKTSDSARYKALGNSIALPPWKWVLKRLCAQYERDATMASLFDGIGGFPLIWEQINGKGSCLWASEIEEFPIAVTKVRLETR